MSAQANFGMIGLAVMGRNLALNVSDHGFKVAVWNLETDVMEDFVKEHSDHGFVGAKTLESFVASLERPRRIMMMIKAGKPVDIVLEQLKPLLEPGDIVIDGGNTHFPETQRREADLAAAKLNFVGMGVSGGEEGARHGPSLMPGGSKEAWAALKPVLEAISAKTDSGPCVTHVGPDGAGHFVKMVHNGIEYGDMQLIAEAYDILNRGLGLAPKEISEIFAQWNEGPLASFLIEISAKILAKVDGETGKPLVDVVLDKAGQKGTGRWTAVIALELGVSIPTIAGAIDARVLSSKKAERERASEVIRGQLGGKASAFSAGVSPEEKSAIVQAVHDALLASKICSYAQGLDLIQEGSKKFGWDIDLAETARIWTGGCIIRAALLDDIMATYKADPTLTNLLLDKTFETRLFAAQPGWRRALELAQDMGIPTLSTAASLNYFDSYRTARLPQNLTQAQRDAFGAHTYIRTDAPERGAVHSEWLKDG